MEPLSPQVQEALAAARQPFQDTRVSRCELEAHQAAPNQLALRGEVLDEDTRAAVARVLAERLPGQVVDWSSVAVLRGGEPARRWVSTNLTSLHAKPSWLAEQLSQLLGGAPLEVLREQGDWRLVRQDDGYLGWAYGPYLSETRPEPVTDWVCEPVAAVRQTPSERGPLASRLLGGTGVAVQERSEGWARVALPGARIGGWVAESALRPLASLPHTEALRRRQLLADAERFRGVPYLWGGTSALGIDCSGFAQLLHRLVGRTIPRDADQQFAAGASVEEPFQPGDLLFFGGDDDPRAITHVAISTGGWQIIHSSRSRNGVYSDDVQASEYLTRNFAGARTFLRDEA